MTETTFVLKRKVHLSQTGIIYAAILTDFVGASVMSRAMSGLPVNSHYHHFFLTTIAQFHLHDLQLIKCLLCRIH